MDQTKYINTYIEFTMGSIQELMNANIQLRTQLKLANDEIEKYKKELEQLNMDEYQTALKNAKSWEDGYHAAMNKASHLDTALKQIADLNAKLVQKDKEIESFRKQENKVEKKPKKKLLLEVPKEISSTKNALEENDF